MADDVTDPKPLRGGRQRSNRIVTHRIELGLWERKQMEPYVDALAAGAVVKNVVLPSAALIAAVGGGYWAVKQVGTLQEAYDEGRGLVRPVAKAARFFPGGGPISALAQVWLANDKAKRNAQGAEQGS